MAMAMAMAMSTVDLGTISSNQLLIIGSLLVSEASDSLLCLPAPYLSAGRDLRVGI